jgi:hypothetical protein
VKCAKCNKECAPLPPQYVLTIRKGMLDQVLAFHDDTCLGLWLESEWSGATQCCLDSDDVVIKGKVCIHGNETTCCIQVVENDPGLKGEDGCAHGETIEALEDYPCPLAHPHCELANA